MCFQMYYYLGGDEVIGEHYKDRLQPPDSPTTTNNASVLLSNMQGSDSGTYTCQVHNYPDVDGKSDASIRVTVLGKIKHDKKYIIIMQYHRGKKEKRLFADEVSLQ